MDTFFLETQAKIVANSKWHENGQCRIWTGPIKQGSNYGVVRYKDPRDPQDAGHRSKGAHRMALLVSDTVRDLDISPNFVASHLCNNSLCINAAHLNLEQQTINNNRAICFANDTCYGHGDESGRRRPDCRVHLNDKTKSYLLRK